MPKIVDAEQRRADICDAVWRVIVRDGLEHASVRSVAREAGLSIGSLRHYFETQDELLAHTLTTVGERLAARMSGVGTSGDSVARVCAKVDEMLPLDADRRHECEVWLAFTARAQVDPALAQQQQDISRRLEEAFTHLIGLLRSDGRLRAELDAEREALRLSALVDGLILRGLTSDVSATRLRDVVSHHLDDITVVENAG